MENTNPKEILENIIKVMEKTHTDTWEIDKLVVILNYINQLEEELDRTRLHDMELEVRIDKAIEILKLCNSKCAKEVIDILRGKDNE